MPRAPQVCRHHGCPNPHPCTTHPPAPQRGRVRTHRADGYDSRWDKLSQDYRRDHPHCAHCARDTTQVDHIVPRDLLIRFGLEPDQDPYLQPLCTPCHARKSRTADKIWREHPNPVELFNDPWLISGAHPHERPERG